MHYYHNGKQVDAAYAKKVILDGYHKQGYACPAEFDDVWLSRFDQEASRDTLFCWSNYSLEIFTDSEDSFLED